MTGPRDRSSTSGRSALRPTRRSVLAVSAGVLTTGGSLPRAATSTPAPLDRQALGRVAGQALGRVAGQALGRVAALDPPPASDDHSFVGGHAHDGRS